MYTLDEKIMNLTEAIRENLVVRSWDPDYPGFRSKWRLVQRIEGNSLIVTGEEYTRTEAQDLINLLERAKIDQSL
ncbi:MAG: hypothetical protein M1372_00825 [Patescibacteria group bacterium]|nr:hypothetical protein [Patescibacteria group bacterium]